MKPRKFFFEKNLTTSAINCGLGLDGEEATNVRDGWAQTIAKWRFMSIQKEPTLDGGRITCGLCNVFRNQSDRENCTHKELGPCPIAAFMQNGEDCRYCHNTPYRDYHDALYDKMGVDDLRYLSEQMLCFVLMVYNKWKAEVPMKLG